MTGDHQANRQDQWPLRIFRLGQEPTDDLSDSTTPEQRLDMLDVLSRRMWELSGKPRPTYARSQIPIRVVDRHG